MTNEETGPTRFPWPPLIYLGAIAASVALDTLYPLPWLGSPLADILFAFGLLLVVAFTALIVSAIRTMRKAKTTILPTHKADALVTNGVFSLSRNPIYLANTLLVTGLGFIIGNAWFLLAAALAVILTQKLAIEPEERHLALHFGKRYRDYQKKVRRWF